MVYSAVRVLFACCAFCLSFYLWFVTRLPPRPSVECMHVLCMYVCTANAVSSWRMYEQPTAALRASLTSIILGEGGPWELRGSEGKGYI